MSKPRLFHLFKSCPEHTWIDGEQAVRFEWDEDGKQVAVYVDDGEEGYFIFEDQDVDLTGGCGKVMAVDATAPAEVDFEVPYFVQVNDKNWEEYLPTPQPLKEPQ